MCTQVYTIKDIYIQKINIMYDNAPYPEYKWRQKTYTYLEGILRV